MSDDLPVIFTDQIVTRAKPRPCAVFASAATAAQMQQYATAGWHVAAAAGFQSAASIDLAAVPAVVEDPEHLAEADLLSLEATGWSAAIAERIARHAPDVVKVNCAFHGIADRTGDEIAARLAALGYTVLATYWRDDNIYRFSSVSRLDHLAVFEPRDWKRMNMIAVRGPERVRTMLVIGRLYAGEEQRIAELRLGHAVRGDHIARLEDAMMALQRRV